MAQRLCRVYCDFMLDKNKGIKTFMFRRKQLNSDKMKLGNFTFVKRNLFLSKMPKSKLHLINQTLSDFQLVSYSTSMTALSIITECENNKPKRMTLHNNQEKLKHYNFIKHSLFHAPDAYYK